MSDRVCTKCKNLLSLDNFSPIKRDGSGEVVLWHCWCKDCRRKSAREDRIRKGAKIRKLLFVDEQNCLKECGECGKILSTVMFSESRRGSLGVSSYCRECVVVRNSLREQEEKRRLAREATQRYRERHRQRWRAMHRIHQFNRKSRIKATDDGSVTDAFLEELFKKEACCWCGKIMEDGEKTIEHIVELCDGGTHSASNIDLACLSCNSSRKNKRKVKDD